MKHRTRDLSSQLANDYAKTFLSVMRDNCGMTIRQLHLTTIHRTAPCWYISTTQAMRYINRINAGKGIVCSERRRRMYYDLYERVRLIAQLQPQRDLHSIVTEIVDSAAPEFYISLRTAYRLLSRYRKTRREQASAHLTNR